MSQKAYFYNVDCRARFSATTESKIILNDQSDDWYIIDTSSVEPGDEITVAGFNAIAPDSASTLIEIGRESESEGFFFMSDNYEAVGSAVVVLESQNYLSIHVEPVDTPPQEQPLF